MCDVVFHLTHAVGVEALSSDSGEDGLVKAYLKELRARLPPDRAAAYSDELVKDGNVYIYTYMYICVYTYIYTYIYSLSRPISKNSERTSHPTARKPTAMSW